MSKRPERPFGPPPEGYEWVAAPDDSWRLTTTKLCRRLLAGPRRGCRAPSVAELARRRYGARGTETVWWAYCADHLYGRWIEDGHVMGWVLRERAS